MNEKWEWQFVLYHETLDDMQPMNANIRKAIRESLCQQSTCYNANGLLASCQSSARVVGGGGHFTSAILGSVLSEISDFQHSWGFMVSLVATRLTHNHQPHSPTHNMINYTKLHKYIFNWDKIMNNKDINHLSWASWLHWWWSVTFETVWCGLMQPQ